MRLKRFNENIVTRNKNEENKKTEEVYRIRPQFIDIANYYRDKDLKIEDWTYGDRLAVIIDYNEGDDENIIEMCDRLSEIGHVEIMRWGGTGEKIGWYIFNINKGLPESKVYKIEIYPIID